LNVDGEIYLGQVVLRRLRAAVLAAHQSIRTTVVPEWLGLRLRKNDVEQVDIARRLASGQGQGKIAGEEVVLDYGVAQRKIEGVGIEVDRVGGVSVEAGIRDVAEEMQDVTRAARLVGIVERDL
jgi:hypothetical protein